MRWHVETSSLSGPVSRARDKTVTVEAESWQRALQTVRVSRGERAPISGFSLETLAEGATRATDPIRRMTYMIRPAAEDAALSDLPVPPPTASTPALDSSPRLASGASGASGTAAAPVPAIAAKPFEPMVPLARASATLVDAKPPPDDFPFDAPSAPEVKPEAEEEPTLPHHSALDPDATDETMATLPLPAATPGAPVVLFRREQAPSPAAPLHYREYVLALPPGTNEDEAEAILRGELARVQMDLQKEGPGKLVNLAAFDELFTGPPKKLPLVTLTWKDWRGEPVIDRPRKRGTAAPVQPMSFPPPANAPRPSAAPPPPAASIAAPPPAMAPLIDNPVVEEEEAPLPPPPQVPQSPRPDTIPPDTLQTVAMASDPPPPSLRVMRKKADSLLPLLFEAMHDLAFLRDAVEGAYFCLNLAMSELPAAGAIVHLYDMERRVFDAIAVKGAGVQERLHTTTPDGDPRFRTAVREGVSRGQSDYPRANTPNLTQDGDVILAPIVKDGRYLGAIELVGSTDGEPLGDDEANALTYIAGQYAEFVSTRGMAFSHARIPATRPQRPG